MTSKEKNTEKMRINKIISYPYFEVRPKTRGSQIVISGAIGISEVDAENVLVKCHGVKLHISGKDMKINVLEHNVLEFFGKVEDIKIINAAN